MGYPDHGEDPEADATGAFRAFRPSSADGIQYADSGRLPDGRLPDGRLPDGRLPDGRRWAAGGNVPDEGGFPQAGWYPDADTGTGTYPLLDWYAGYERYSGEQPGRPQAAAGEHPFTRPYVRPADPWDALPPENAPGTTWSSLAVRLSRLRPDRWVLAGGGLAAAVAVIVAFATAGGSTATPAARTAQTATTHSVQPACASPVPGH